MAQLGQLGIGVNLDLSKFEGNVTGLKRSMRDVDSTMKASISSFEGLEKSTEALGVKYDGLKKKQEIQKKIVEEQRKKYEELAKTQGENSREAQNARIELNKQQTVLNKLEGELVSVSSEMKNMKKENSILADSFKKLEGTLDKVSEKLKKTSDDLVGIGKGFSKYVTAPVAGFGTAALVSASSFEESSVRIQNSLGLTEKEAKKLTETARNIYKDGYGESVEEIDNALLQTKQNMTDLNDADLEEATRNALILGQTFDADVNEVTRASNNLMHGFGLTSQEAFDLMANGAQNGLNFSNEMFDNLSEYSSLFGKMGYSAEEYFQLLQNGSEAGVYNLDYVNDVMKEFQIRVKDNSKSTTEAMGQLSGETQEVWNSFMRGEGTVKDVSNAVLGELSGMEDQVAANEIGVSLFGTKWEDLEADAMYALGGINGELGDTSGKMEKMAENMEELPMQRLTSLFRELTGALTPFGEIMLDMAEEWMPSIESAIETVTNTFNDLDEDGKKAVVTFAGIGALIGPLIVALGGFVGVVGMALKPLAGLFGILGGKGIGGLLGLLGKRFLFLLGPIGALVGGFFLFKDVLTGLGLDGIMEKFKELGNVIKGLFTRDDEDEDSEGGGLLEKLGITPEMIEKIKSVMGTIKENIEKVVGVFVDNLMPIIKEAIDWLKGLFESLRTFWDENGEGILTVIEKIHTFITGVLVTALPIVFAVIKSVFDNIKGFLGGAFEAIGGIIKLIVGVFTGDFTKMWEGVKSIFFGAFDLIWNGIQLLFFGKLVKGVAGLVKAVVGSFKSLWTRSVGIFKSLWNGVVQIFKDLVSGVTGKVTQLRTGIVKGITRAKDRAVAVLRNLKDRAKGIFEDMVKFAKDLPGKIGDAIKNGAKSAVDGIISLGNKMAGKLGDVVNGVIGGINNVTAKLGIEAKVEKWEVPSFSTGTKRGGHAGGLMTVGDRGPGNSAVGKTRELVQYPNGLVQLFEKETTLNAPKGTQVLSNRDTEKVLSIPKYSRGTEGAGGILSKAKDIVGNVKDKITGAIGNVWDAIKNPGNLINKIIDTLGLKIQGITKFPLDLAKGAFGKIKEGFKGFLTNAREKATPESNLGALLSGHKINWAYGKYPFAFNGGNHYGIDTDHVYDPVRAAIGGKVRRYFFDNYGGGNTLEIQSGKIYQWYSHLSKSLVKAGDSIKAGQKIAVSGNTGTNSTGPHLHYQLFRNLANPNGSSFDPIPYLRGKGKGNGGGAFDYFTGGVINDEGFYRLAEKGSELVVPTDDKTAMVKMLHYLNDLIGNDGSGNTRTSQIPTPKNTGGSGEDSLMREQNEMLREMISMMKEARNRDKEDLELARRRNEVLEGVLEKDFGVVLDGRKVSKQLYPHIKKESDRESNKDWRLGRV